MPYKVVGRNVHHFKEGKWSLKQRASSHENAKKTMNLLYGIESGWKPTGKNKTWKNYKTRKKGGQHYWIGKYQNKSYGPHWKKIKDYDIQEVGPHDLNDYGGINHYAAKELKFRPTPRKNDILIEKDKPNFMRSTLLHEVTEVELMRGGMSYDLAHKRAINAELNAGMVPKKILLENNDFLSRQLQNKRKPIKSRLYMVKDKDGQFQGYDSR